LANARTGDGMTITALALHSGASEFFILNQSGEGPEPEFKSWDKLP
jgi:hypothetical protein